MEVLTTAGHPPIVLLRPVARAQQLQSSRARRWQRGYLEPTCTLRHPDMRDPENRIREQLRCSKQLPSPYDTAWVAMVPAQGAPRTPRFPKYVEWIMQNQHDNGSWGLGHFHLPWLGKDAVSSTLACIIALKTWNVGDEHIRKGLCFIGDNSACIMDDNCDKPVGFNIIFPRMIRLGIELGLEFPLRQFHVQEILHLQEMDLRSSAPGRKAYAAYVAEGLEDIQDWDEVLRYQRKNGSLFNSPSATSALAIHRRDTNALKYLDLLGNKFPSSVPVAYPMNIYSQLCMVDIIEKMGISCHFTGEINSILDMTYRSWLQNEEELVEDMETCAIAFRLLRMHGYNISSDALSHISEEPRFQDSVHGHINDTKTLLELYKASQIRILEDEPTLGNIASWSRKLLQGQLGSKRVSRPVTPQEVEYTLKFPYYSATVEPLEHRRSIEHFDTMSIQMKKSAYLACPDTEDILALATERFRSAQYVYQHKLQCIERWMKEVGLHHLKFARVTPSNLFIFMGATVFPPESYNASLAWIQNSILTTVADDFFDGGGSIDELRNLVALIEEWDAHTRVGFSSKDVEILFYAIYNTNNQIGAKAALVQNRRVIGHIAEAWADLVRATMAEAEWTSKRYVPTMEEYLQVAEVSSALVPIVVSSLYLVGPEVSEDMVRTPEYKKLLRHMCISSRLINDIGTYEKEMSQGYINSVLLRGLRDGVQMSPESIEAAKVETRGAIADSRRELLRLVVSDGGAVPRPCRDIFWNTLKIAHRFYAEGDGFSLPQELVAAVNAVVHEPLQGTHPSC